MVDRLDLLLPAIVGLSVGLIPWLYERRPRRRSVEATAASTQIDAADKITATAMSLLEQVEGLWRQRLEDCEGRHAECAQEMQRLLDERDRLRRLLETPEVP